MAGPTLLGMARGTHLREYTFAHYHLGARWFGALGYHDLYEQTLAAGGPSADGVRDLRTYAIGSAEPARSPAWSDADWRAFQADVAALTPRQSDASWRSWYRDKGYNASPAWTATLGRLLGARPASGGWFRVVAWMDVGLLALGLLALAWGFGVAPALAVGAAVVLWPGSRDDLLGGPLQTDWFAALCASAACLRRDRPMLGGALLGWSAASRLFPALLLLGPLVLAARGQQNTKRVLVGAAVVGLLALGLGSTTPRGPAAWGEFAGKMQTHTALHHLGDRRVGLKPLLAWAPVRGTDAEARADRTARWEGRAPVAWGLTALLVLGFGTAFGQGLRERTRPNDPFGALLLGLPLTFLLLTLSRYYVLAPALLLIVRPRWLGASFLLVAALGQAALVADARDANVWALVNLGLLALTVLGMGAWARRPDAFSASAASPSSPSPPSP